MKILFSSHARQELEEARQYYELSAPGLGRRFRAEIKAAALRIANCPEAWPLEPGSIRKYLPHRFPCKILYSVEENHIFLIAIAHMHRKPDYWIERLPG